MGATISIARTWKPIVTRATDILRNEGIFSLWCKILAVLGYRRVLLIERPLDQPISPVGVGLPVTMSRLREGEVEEYLAFSPEVDAADISRRLQAGHQCFVARYEGRIVHARWAAIGRARIGFLARDLDLAPDEVYMHGSYTSSSFRGYNIAPACSGHVMRYYQEAGYRRSVAIVFPENHPACRSAEKSGFRPLGIMGYIKLGPWRHDFYRAQPQGVTWVRAGRHDRPRLPHSG